MQTQTKPRTGLYMLFLQRLKELQEELHKDLLPFPEVRRKICPAFSIKKEQCWELLYLLCEFGLIEIVPYHGVKLNSKFIS